MSRDIRSGDSSLTYTSTKTVIKKTTRFVENVSTTSITKQQTSVNIGKENRFGKESEAAGSIVKQLKVFYEERSINDPQRVIVNGVQNVTSTGAIRKRRASENSTLTELERPKNLVPKKRPGIHDNDTFGKSRFKIYTEGTAKIVGQNDEKERKKSARNLENDIIDKSEPHRSLVAVDTRFEKIRCPFVIDNLQRRFTPADVLPVPQVTKKIKVLHRNNLSTKVESCATAIVARDSKYELPYEDFIIKYELEKEISASKLSRNFRQRNITVAQRLILVKFLTRLHTHLFLPSFLLHQTVKLFDAVIDAKVVEVQNMQLIALGAMWIALKREQIDYNIPKAKEIISFAKDLYEGKVELLLKCEIDILQTLNFNIVFPDPITIMYYDIIKCHRSQFMNSQEIHRAYCCGCYMIDLSLFDEDIMKYSVVLLAAAAAEAALYFAMENVNINVEPAWHLWRAQHTANSFSEKEIGTLRTMLIRKVFESLKRHSSVEIVFKKYLRSRYGRISQFLGNKVKLYLHEE